MKYYYIAVQRKIESGYYAYWIRVSTSDNLKAKLEPFTAANICPTKKAAQQLAAFWDQCFRDNGTWAFTGSDDELLPF